MGTPAGNMTEETRILLDAAAADLTLLCWLHDRELDREFLLRLAACPARDWFNGVHVPQPSAAGVGLRSGGFGGPPRNVNTSTPIWPAPTDAHALPQVDVNRRPATVLWSAVFITVSTLYRPVEQLLPEVILEAADRLGDGRLRPMHFGGGPGEAALLRHRQEDPESGQVHKSVLL